MSASKDKLLRKKQIEAGTDKRTLAMEKEAKQRRKSTITYIVVAVLLVVFFAFIFIYNSAWPSRHMTAVEINGEKYTVAQLNYYYSNEYVNFYNNYYSYISYGMFFDPQQSLADQEYAEGTSWRQYFLDTAVQSMTQVQMLNEKAEDAGFTLSQEQQDSYDAQIADLQTAWQDLGYQNLDQYLNMNYGKGVDLELVKTELYRSMVASAYSESVYDSYEYSEADLGAYYLAHANDMDIIDYVYYSIGDGDLDGQAMADAVDGTDEETFAAYLAEHGDEDAEPLDQSVPGSSVSTSDYGEFLLDHARKSGDATYVETDSAKYVVMFLGRDDNEYKTPGFRHILIEAEDADGDGEFSQEEIDAAADEAQEVYDEWKAGDATEDSFAELANERSDDAGSNTNGGLYENVTKGAMVEPIDQWLFDESRKAGDTTVVSYDGDNYTGTHVLYFTGLSDQTYAQQQADQAMRSEDYNAWQEEALADYQAVTSHMGMAGKHH